MPTSRSQINANRINGSKAHGPKDTTSTRFNATKHGLLALGITELDDAEGFRAIVVDLTREKKPVGILEIKLLEAAALDIVRWTRARRLEAEFITAVVNPPQHEKDFLRDLDSNFQGPVLDPGIPAAIGAGSVQQLVTIFQRYESYFANRLFRTLHELERLQRIRQGERLPAPAAINFNLHADAGTSHSTPAVRDQSTVSPSDGESLPDPVAGEVNGLADAGTLDCIPAEPEQPKGPYGDSGSLPAPLTVEVKGDSRVLDPAPSESDHFADPAAAGVIGGQIPATDSTQVEWTPRAPSGPIWRKR
jgi:hypothetical protein